MKKILTKISSILFAALICLSFAGCEFFDFSGPSSGQKLDTPTVVISYDGEAVWGEIDGALYYVYVIDDGEEKPTSVCHVQLEENQSIKVKAISGLDEYDDSDFSVPVTYKKINDSEHTHTDVNSDGKCDLCGDSVTVELSFYAVNDLHGKFMDTDNQPGVDEFTTYMKNLYADPEREEILLASGDMWQGTVESSTNKGQLMTDWMNEMGFVSMTLGNHEYDWGAAVLNPNSEKANFPFLAINVRQNGSEVDYCQASTVVEKGGVKIGIIGAIGDCLSSISGDFTDGLYFATDSMLTSLVKLEAARLREEENCDFIVYSIHDGGSGFGSGITSVTNSQMSWYDSSLSNGYVDLVFEAHTHQAYILKDEFGVYHLQAGGENRAISSAAVSFNTVTQTYSVTPRLIYASEYANSSIVGDSVVEDIFTEYFPTENPYTTVLGANRSKKYSDAVCEKVAELYYRKGLEKWGNQYVIALGGGYLKTRSPYNLDAGNVTYADLFSILPFDNEIVLGKISGSDLKSKFLAGRDNYYTYSAITTSQVSDSQTYFIIVDSYTSTYKYNRITEVARLGSGIYARDLLADFIRGGGWA